jgi:hypothetical protein
VLPPLRENIPACREFRAAQPDAPKLAPNHRASAFTPKYRKTTGKFKSLTTNHTNATNFLSAIYDFPLCS